MRFEEIDTRAVFEARPCVKIRVAVAVAGFHDLSACQIAEQHVALCAAKGISMNDAHSAALNGYDHARPARGKG